MASPSPSPSRTPASAASKKASAIASPLGRTPAGQARQVDNGPTSSAERRRQPSDGLSTPLRTRRVSMLSSVSSATAGTTGNATPSSSSTSLKSPAVAGRLDALHAIPSAKAVLPARSTPINSTKAAHGPSSNTTPLWFTPLKSRQSTLVHSTSPTSSPPRISGRPLANNQGTSAASNSGTSSKVSTAATNCKASSASAASPFSPNYGSGSQTSGLSDGGQDIDDELETVLVTESTHDLDAEMHEALSHVEKIHAGKLVALKRLLSEKDAASAHSLHGLHGEIQRLEETVQTKEAELVQLRRDLANLQTSAASGSGHASSGNKDPPKATSPAGATNSFSSSVSAFSHLAPHFDEPQTRSAIRRLNGQERLRLLRIVLESVMPGDISAMQTMLAKYAASTFDIVGRLPPQLGTRILARLPVLEMLDARRVSKAWRDLIDHDEEIIWRQKVLEITATDTSPPTSPTTPDGWYSLYRALHHRESNWRRGLAQDIVLMQGHKGFVTSLKKYGDTVVTGSYDETIRIWSAATGKCLKVLPVAGSIACLDYLHEKNIVACGCHDVGRVYVLSTLTGTLLAKLSGHNKGLKAVAINSKYLVSAGMDKALVVWDWRNGGKKLVRFGQQTNVNIGIALVESKLVSVQVDGMVRTFDLDSRTMIGQFAMKDLLRGHRVFQPWLNSLNLSSTNVVMWFAANEDRITMGTRDFLLYYRWDQFNKPPELYSWIQTDASTNDLSVGVSDPSKQRVLTSVRFASRTGTDRRIYIGHFDESSLRASQRNDEESIAAHLIRIGGAWQAASSELQLDSPQMNPMTLACDNERVIVGCTSGLVYTISFVGYKYR